MKKREILRASFNLEDEHELELYNHASKNSNVSAFIKRLIFLDMVGKGEVVSDRVDDIPRVEDDDMSSFT